MNRRGWVLPRRRSYWKGSAVKKVILVSLLGFLAAGQPTAQAELPATGQTFCRDKDLSIPMPMPPLTSCDVTECPGQDGDFQAGCPMVDRFVILPGPNGLVEDPEGPMDDDTVFDRCTGLEWQRGTADIGGDGSPDVPDGVADEHDRRSWSEALTYCEDLEYAGHDDWRLPNAIELQSIPDYGRAGAKQDQTLIDDAFTLGTYPGANPLNTEAVHWTSTSRPACFLPPSPQNTPRCYGGLTPDNLLAVVVGFNGPSAGGMGQEPLRPYDKDTQTFGEDDTLFLVRAVRRGTINAAAGGGADGDGAERGGGAGPMCAADTDNGNANGDGARDLSDAVYELAWLFQGGPIPVPFCTMPGPKAEGCARENGNTNGDGARDLSDVVYLLAWLFQGGPEPVAPCPDLAAPEICTGGVDEDLDGDVDCADADCVFLPGCDIATPLPTTGVTSCYNESGATITCAEAETLGLGGQDAAYQAGGCITDEDRFELKIGPDEFNDLVDDETIDDTVIDHCTGLEWTRWRLQDEPPGGAWCDLIEHCKVNLNAGFGFGGEAGAEKKGWRCPNVREAASLLQYGLPAPQESTDTLIDFLFGKSPGKLNQASSSTLYADESFVQVDYARGTFSAPESGGLTVSTRVMAVRDADPP